jgi:fumarylacetoacetate (FAA) hydrolase family protein
VAIRNDGVFDISKSFSLVRDIFETDDPAAAVRAAKGERLGSVEEILANSHPARQNFNEVHFLSPIDLQVVKASGVTFAVSMIERVIEEKSLGDKDIANQIRDKVTESIGANFASLKPGSAKAMELKKVLIAEGLWSQYLEVGIGPDAEIFTKASTLATMGFGDLVGIHSSSTWNNPEPEVVLIVSSSGTIHGATLGNDVNLRDIEGRSALLLPKAKDNNASGSLGPWIRLFDDTFSLGDVRQMAVTMTVDGPDGYRLQGSSDMTQISRDPEDLVSQLMGTHHQYPDGVVLYLGTLFAPTQDRGEKGKGFTHVVGDVVTISSPLIGSLMNEVQLSEACPPWSFGIRDLFNNLSDRRML